VYVRGVYWLASERSERSEACIAYGGNTGCSG
jgi:hypothetical protein